MGDSWEHDEFRKGKQFWGRPNPEERFFDLPPTIDDRKVRLDEVLLRVRSSFVYTYDMGDSWEHAIVLEKRLPEDRGGIPGFYDLLEAGRNPEHPRHEELLEWVGEEWDPDAFSLDDVNQRLHGRRRRSI